MSSEGSIRRPHGRAPSELRSLDIELGPLKFAAGSALIRLGDTQVLAAAAVENRVPPFLANSGRGWVTAEYSMLPQATPTRSVREVSRGRPSGRTAEIQRLIGRSLRAVIDFGALGERTVTLDCDVLQADGGTRTASITAAYVALVQALGPLLLTGDLDRWPVRSQVAAVSVGIVAGHAVLDLEYTEDRDADVDMNVVATVDGRLVEIQGTGEERTYTRPELDTLLDLALGGIQTLAAAQRRALTPVLADIEAARGPRSTAPAKEERELWGPP